jgi:hypothetical protein
VPSLRDALAKPSRPGNVIGSIKRSGCGTATGSPKSWTRPQKAFADADFALMPWQVEELEVLVLGRLPQFDEQT